MGQGYRLAVHGDVSSTNDLAMACAKAGDPGKLWILAEAQTQGRGRQGRQWASPSGNFYGSLLLIDAAEAARAPELGFVAGIALARSLRTLAAQDARLRIKWPNDIVFDGAKLSGMLLESLRLDNGRQAFVIGIGVNCVSYPREAPYRVTSLSEIVGAPIIPQDVLMELSAELCRWLEVWSRGAGFATIRGEWLGLAAGLGAQIKVVTPTLTREGLFRTIDAAGRLILETPTAAIAVEAGDVFFVDRPKGTLAGLSN